MRYLLATMCVLALSIGLARPGLAQDTPQQRAQSLADVRAELQALGGEIAALRNELVSTGAVAQFGGASALERMDAIEAALTTLTGRTEALQFRIEGIVSDATNRLADLEFRLVELEGGDVSALGQTRPLGGADALPSMTGTSGSPGSAAPQLAESEQADFDRARAVLGQGDFRTAADLFATFAETYPGGPVTGEALLLRGDALAQLGETASAARSYLEAFSGAPDGPRAPEALLRLGQSLGRLGQVNEACLMLAEVDVRFPDGQAAADAVASMRTLGCP